MGHELRMTYSSHYPFAGNSWAALMSRALVQLAQRRDRLERFLTMGSCDGSATGSDILAWGELGRTVQRVAALDSSGKTNEGLRSLYDWWVARHLGECNLFLGLNGTCLRSIQAAQSRGAVSVVGRFSTHPQTQARILDEEYERWGYGGSRWWKLRLHRYLVEIESCDYVLIPSDFVAESFVEHGFDAGRLLNVPFGVDAERFKPGSGERQGGFRVLFVGLVDLRKGVPYLLEAWHGLRLPDAELIFAGDIVPNIKQVLQRYTHLENVRFLGYARDPAPIYQSADVFVFPSLEEGSALVTYEAMACGLPCIVTPSAGSLVRDKYDGIVVPARDARALREAIEILYADSALRQQMSLAARQRVALYTWTRYAETVLDAFEQIIASGD